MEEKKVPTVHYIVVVAFCLLFRFVPGVGGITPMGMAILGTFIGAVYGWTVIGNFWPSIIALLGMGLTVGMNPMLAAGFGNIVFFGLAFAMPIIGVGTETGAFSWVVNKVLTSKALQGRGYLTVWSLMMLAFFLGMTNPIIMCLVLCSFVVTICKQVGYKKNEKFPVFVCLGIAFSSMLGQVLLPFASTGLSLISSYNAMFPDAPLNYLSYLCFIPPMGIIMTTVYVLLCKFAFRVDVSKLALFHVEGESEPMNRDQKKSIAFFLVWIGLLIVSSLPLGQIAVFLSGFGLVGFTLLIIALLDIVKREDGTKMLEVEKSFRLVPWGMCVMMAYIMCISAFLNKPETGITAALSALLTPFMALPPLVFIVVALLFAVLLTNFANNVVIIILVMPFMFNFASMIGLSPTSAICLLIVMGQFALITPAASPITAVAMSSEMVEPKTVMKAALKMVPLLVVVCLCIGWPFSQLII